jgi:L-threonylcarbamoyladenylate synthase
MEDEIKNCLLVLQKGGIILYPTDTIWGIGCDATNSLAVAKIYLLKRRMERKSLIILLAEAAHIRNYVTVVPGTTWKLIEQADTPLTIIYPDAKNLAENVVAEDGSVAIRVVKNEFCRRLINTFGKPIVSTSANISGRNPPPAYGNIDQEIVQGVDYAVDEALARIYDQKPSRIIKLNPDGEFLVIRK